MRFTIYKMRIAGSGAAAGGVPGARAPELAMRNRGEKTPNRQNAMANAGGFTMIEIALCLAIVGFALVSILLVLPSGMNTQSQTREETVIGEDASELMEAIRSGARGLDDLTNYVYAITNYYTDYNTLGKVIDSGYYGYTYNNANFLINPGSSTALPGMYLTNGLRIIGLLSTPEFTAGKGGAPIASTFNTSFTSNHLVAYVHSMSGLAAEKPPQNNAIMQASTFSYRVHCFNAPVAEDTNAYFNSINYGYMHQLAGNLRELRLLFAWPQYPNGSLGEHRQSFRSTIAGQLALTNYANYYPGISALYFYQPDYYTNTP